MSKFILKNDAIYLKIKRMIVEDALSNLPKQCFKDLSEVHFYEPFLKALLIMREQGNSIIYYDSIENILICPSFFSKTLVNKDAIKYEERYRFTINNHTLDNSNVILFGDLEEPEIAKFHVTDSQQKALERYNEILINGVSKYKDSFAWILKLQDYHSSLLGKSKYKDLITQKLKSIVNRSSSSITQIDKDDDMQVVQMSMDWFPNFIDIYKKDICVKFDVIFTRLFGESSTGFNATGEGDRIVWYDKVEAFITSFLIKPLGKLYSILGKEKEFNSLEFTSIDSSDRAFEIEEKNNIKQDILDFYTTGIIDKQTALKLIKEKLNYSFDIEDIKTEDATSDYTFNIDPQTFENGEENGRY